jgi:hypothetical protein
MAWELHIPADERIIYQGSCHNHSHNTSMNQVELYLAHYLESHLKESLDIIPPHHRVTCRLSELFIQIYKEYNFTANYPKRHGDTFHDWLRKYQGNNFSQRFLYVAEASRIRHLKEPSQYMMHWKTCLDSQESASSSMTTFCNVVSSTHLDPWR